MFFLFSFYLAFSVFEKGRVNQVALNPQGSNTISAQSGVCFFSIILGLLGIQCLETKGLCHDTWTQSWMDDVGRVGSTFSSINLVAFIYRACSGNKALQKCSDSWMIGGTKYRLRNVSYSRTQTQRSHMPTFRCTRLGELKLYPPTMR